MTTTSLLVRIYNAFVEARMRAAMRELALHPTFRDRAAAAATDAVPQDEAGKAGYKATYADAGMLPFVRGA